MSPRLRSDSSFTCYTRMARNLWSWPPGCRSSALLAEVGGGVQQLADCAGRALPRRDGEQVVVQAQEAGQGALGWGQGTKASRDWRFEFLVLIVVERFLVALPGSVAREPGQVKGTQVSGCEFGADAGDRGQLVFRFLVP